MCTHFFVAFQKQDYLIIWLSFFSVLLALSSPYPLYQFSVTSSPNQYLSFSFMFLLYLIYLISVRSELDIQINQQQYNSQVLQQQLVAMGNLTEGQVYQRKPIFGNRLTPTKDNLSRSLSPYLFNNSNKNFHLSAVVNGQPPRKKYSNRQYLNPTMIKSVVKNYRPHFDGRASCLQCNPHPQDNITAMSRSTFLKGSNTRTHKSYIQQSFQQQSPKKSTSPLINQQQSIQRHHHHHQYHHQLHQHHHISLSPAPLKNMLGASTRKYNKNVISCKYCVHAANYGIDGHLQCSCLYRGCYVCSCEGSRVGSFLESQKIAQPHFPSSQKQKSEYLQFSNAPTHRKKQFPSPSPELSIPHPPQLPEIFQIPGATPAHPAPVPQSPFTLLNISPSPSPSPSPHTQSSNNHNKCQDIIKRVRNFNEFLNEIKKKVKKQYQSIHSHAQSHHNSHAHLQSHANSNSNSNSNSHTHTHSNQNSLEQDQSSFGNSNSGNLSPQQYDLSVTTEIIQNNRDKHKHKYKDREREREREKESQKERERNKNRERIGQPNHQKSITLALRLQNEKIELEKYRKMVERELSKQHSVQSIHIDTKEKDKIITINFDDLSQPKQMKKKPLPESSISQTHTNSTIKKQSQSKLKKSGPKEETRVLEIKKNDGEKNDGENEEIQRKGSENITIRMSKIHTLFSKMDHINKEQMDSYREICHILQENTTELEGADEGSEAHTL